MKRHATRCGDVAALRGFIAVTRGDTAPRFAQSETKTQRS
jgi:hypothetical protein